jgi:hypothetical protein
VSLYDSLREDSVIFPNKSGGDMWQGRISFYVKPPTTINYSRTPSNLFLSFIN